MVHDHADRLRSYELVAGVGDQIAANRSSSGRVGRIGRERCRPADSLKELAPEDLPEQLGR